MEGIIMGFDLKTEFGTDEKKEIEGVWEDMGDGFSIKIARANNPNYDKWFTRLTKGIKRQLRNDTVPEEKSRAIMIQIMAKTILLDWKGMFEDGKEVKYSEKEAVRVLTEYKDFRTTITEMSSSITLFRMEEDEDAEKN